MADLRNLISFDGTLESDGLRWAMPFKARLDGDGEIEFEIAPLPVTKETFEINRLWHEERGMPHYFELSGTAPDGTRFTSKTVHFTRLSMPSDETGSRLELRARCNVGTFTQTIEPKISKLAVRQGLRGFECFGSHYAKCPLGEVQLAGVTPLPEGDGLSGWLHIISDTPFSDPAEWRKEVLKLFEHIRHAMSFAESRAIKSPFTQTWADDTFTTEVFSQTPARGPGMQVFHHLNLQPIFDVAVASFFKPPIPAKMLYFAIEWFAMHATYSETRLLNAMTALENLTNANLEDNEKFLLPEERFGEISRLMRGAFSNPVGDAEELFRAGLAGKMKDLNRRSLRDKIMLLAKRWNVPLDDFPPKALGAAIAARNEIVHRGHYYDDGTDKKESLWGHILLIREVVVRMILAILGFKGRYISFLGGAYHDADYP